MREKEVVLTCDTLRMTSLLVVEVMFLIARSWVYRATEGIFLCSFVCDRKQDRTWRLPRREGADKPYFSRSDANRVSLTETFEHSAVELR
jgi:hypothetical protein